MALFAGWQVIDFLNYFSSVFNLMNVAIGSGIIGLGYVANSMGWAPYICFNLFVSVMSIFTLNIVCECSTRVYQWEYKKKEREEKELDNRNEGSITESTQSYLISSNEKGLNVPRHRDPDSFPNAYSYEEIALKLFGKPALIFINICILFYLFSCQCSYMTLIKDTVPGIVEGLGRMAKPDFILNWDTDYFKNGDICLLGVMAVILVPLGFAKKIDFLGFTSAIGMFAMISFVIMIVVKQPTVSDQCGHINYTNPHIETKFNHSIETECEVHTAKWTFESIKSMGICLFAYLSHCNVLAIFAEVRGKSRAAVLQRMNKVIYGAIVPCTILYITAAMFAYSSFYNHTQAQLIQLYEFIQSDGNLILYCNMLVITCIIFSIPLAQYPARNTIWTLLHTLAPQRVPPPFNPSELDPAEKSNARARAFPWSWFIVIMLSQYLFIFAIVWSNADFKLFLSLAGCVSGSTVVMIFPASFWLKMNDWKLLDCDRKATAAFCYFILGLGFVTLFGNTSLILIEEL